MEIYNILGILIFAQLTLQLESLDPKENLKAKDTYIGLPGETLTLKWTYTGTEMYKLVTIYIPEEVGNTKKPNLKLWDLRYFAHNRTFSRYKYNIPKSVLNNLTEFRRETKSIFTLVLKLNPGNMTKFEFICRLEKESFWDVPESKKITVKVAVAPKVHIPMKKGEEIDVPKGRDINLRCEVARGVPTPDIIWKKDSKSLRSKPISQKISVVKLSNVKPADAGRYVCMARNIAGTHSSDVILTVKYIELNSGVPLKVTSALGSLVDLSCPIEGYPQVMYSWIKGNKQLGHRRGLTVKLDKGEDFGNYTCNGKNGFGSKKVTFEIYNDATKSARNFRGGADASRSSSVLTLIAVFFLAWFLH